MPSAYTCLHDHLIFSTKNRAALLTPSLCERLYPYLGGIMREISGCLLEIGGALDHVHLLVRSHTTTAPAEIVRVLKSNSSKWVHETVGCKEFGWQDGYAAFAVSLSSVAKVREYIRGQEEHHQRVSFEAEFLDFLKRHEIPFDERYIWR